MKKLIILSTLLLFTLIGIAQVSTYQSLQNRFLIDGIFSLTKRADSAILVSNINNRVKYTDTANTLAPYVRKTVLSSDSSDIMDQVNNKLNYWDTSMMLINYTQSLPYKLQYIGGDDNNRFGMLTTPFNVVSSGKTLLNIGNDFEYYTPNNSFLICGDSGVTMNTAVHGNMVDLTGSSILLGYGNSNYLINGNSSGYTFGTATDAQVQSSSGNYSVNTPSSSNSIIFKLNNTAYLSISSPGINLTGSARFTRNAGSVTTSGDGTTTAFTITHSLGYAPLQVLVTMTSAIYIPYYISAKTATTFTITFQTAPASGTNNITFDYFLN